LDLSPWASADPRAFCRGPLTMTSAPIWGKPRPDASEPDCPRVEPVTSAKLTCQIEIHVWPPLNFRPSYFRRRARIIKKFSSWSKAPDAPRKNRLRGSSTTCSGIFGISAPSKPSQAGKTAHPVGICRDAEMEAEPLGFLERESSPEGTTARPALNGAGMVRGYRRVMGLADPSVGGRADHQPHREPKPHVCHASGQPRGPAANARHSSDRAIWDISAIPHGRRWLGPRPASAASVITSQIRGGKSTRNSATLREYAKPWDREPTPGGVRKNSEDSPNRFFI